MTIKDYEKYFKGIEPEYVHKLLGVVQAIVPGAKITLYGSRARGDYRENSDIDLALDGGTEIPGYLFVEAQDIVKQLTITHKVDIVDLADARGTFREEILRDGVVLNDLLTIR